MAQDGHVNSKRRDTVIHSLTRLGTAVYRVWDSHRGAYATKELSKQELEDWQLYKSLWNALMDKSYMIKTYVRSLGGRGWWEEGKQHSGSIETHVSPPADFAKEMAHAERAASVALAAVRAYETHVATGGDPAARPIISFEEEKELAD